jgi:adenosylhomocysteine nucleosidase
MCKKIFRVLLLIIPTLSIAAQPIDVAVLTTLPNEAGVIQQVMKNKQIVYKYHARYIVGDINHHHVLLNITGVGSVSAAISSALIMQQFAPTYYIFTGVAAGVQGYRIGDILFAKTVYDFDVGNQELSLPKYPFNHLNPIVDQSDRAEFNVNSKLLYLIQQATKQLVLNAMSSNGQTVTAKEQTAEMASSDSFPFTAFDFKRMHLANIKAIDMGSAGFMKFCWLFTRQCLVVTGISHVENGERSSTTQWNAHNEQFAAKNAAQATLALIEKL